MHNDLTDWNDEPSADNQKKNNPKTNKQKKNRCAFAWIVTSS